MFIKKAIIKNFRIFSTAQEFVIEDINIPNNTDVGSGLNVFVGENGCGKTAILDALALPILEYKSESFSISDLNDPNEKSEISIYSQDSFEVAGTMPKGKFNAKGFKFEGGIRSRENKAYLSSSVVCDQKFISTDPSKPSSSSPDLRVGVNNPFKGKRFSENDILFLDRNRLFQTRTGNFNTTRFDRLMEDFNYQYLKNATVTELNDDLNTKIKQGNVDNAFLATAISKFEEICDVTIKLDFLDNYLPFKEACFVQRKDNHQQISLNNLGSGLEMIFSLLYSFYPAQQSGKQLIIFIDEPELHLHPKLQEKFVEIVLEFSKTAQIFLTSHSPLLVKQISVNDKSKIKIIGKNGDTIEEIDSKVLPYSSANEINFIAFKLATEEYHNELYNEIESNFWNNPNNDFKLFKQNGNYSSSDGRQIIFDNEFFVNQNNEPKNSPFKTQTNKVSLHTYIRNKIHHSNENGGAPSYSELESSIAKLRTFL